MPTNPVYSLAAASARLKPHPVTMTAHEQRAREMQAACLLAGQPLQAAYWERRVTELGFWSRP